MKVKEIFKTYLEEAIGQDNAAIAFSAFDKPSSVSLRKNPFKRPLYFPYQGKEVHWSENGLILESRPQFTLDPLFHGGAYYVQDSSSMFVGHVFRKLLENFRSKLEQGRVLRVLDLCAAPGGKTTDLAASLRTFCSDSFLLVANEVMKQRAQVLADNVALWGDPNVIVTSEDPSSFARLGSFFDIIVADVPCSGEGMFRKDEQAVDQWSEDNVALCQSRQRRIIADVWPSLSQGGYLVYSTCTFNRMENDLNARWIEEELGAECISDTLAYPQDKGIIRTELGFSLVPGLVPGEGQYCSVLCKTSQASELRWKKKNKKLPIYKSFTGLFKDKVDFSVKGDLLIALPSIISLDAEPVLDLMHTLLTGCAAGTLKGDILVPSSDLALSLLYDRKAYPEIEVSREIALAYLHRDAIVLEGAPRGFVLIVYDGIPLGFVKNLGNRCNNLHPASRRIRMDIK